MSKSRTNPDATTAVSFLENAFRVDRAFQPSLVATVLVSDLHRLISETAVLPRAESGAQEPQGGRPPLLASLLEGVARGLPTRAAALLTLLRQTYGDEVGAAEKSLNRMGALCAGFLAAYGDGPVRLLRAPARINILGEHVDYVSYLPTY